MNLGLGVGFTFLKPVGYFIQSVQGLTDWRLVSAGGKLFHDFSFSRPKVQLIAISKRRAGSCLQMAFYELNGLQHGEAHLLPAPDCDRFRIGKTAFDMAEHIMAVLFLPLDPVNNTDLPFGRTFITLPFNRPFILESVYRWSSVSSTFCIF